MSITLTVKRENKFLTMLTAVGPIPQPRKPGVKGGG